MQDFPTSAMFSDLYKFLAHMTSSFPHVPLRRLNLKLGLADDAMAGGDVGHLSHGVGVGDECTQQSLGTPSETFAPPPQLEEKQYPPTTSAVLCALALLPSARFAAPVMDSA
eukprot:395884-Pelagomonas_calceolata.AAC.1